MEEHPRDIAALEKKGYSHAQYPNSAEKRGSRSTAVFNPKDLEHVHTFKSPKFIDRKYEWGKPPPFHRSIKRRRIGSIVKENE